MIEKSLPANWKPVQTETRRDPMLSNVFLYTQEGWPSLVSGNLKPYFLKKNELSVENGIIMWGYRMVVPAKFKKNI